MLFKLSALSFPSASSVWMLGPVAFPRVFYRVLCKPLTSFYLAELSQTSLSLCLSETGVNPGAGEALKGVGGKWQASGFALQLSVAQGQEPAQWSTATACEEAGGCNTWEGQNLQTPASRGGSSPEQKRGRGSARYLGHSAVGSWSTHTLTQQMKVFSKCGQSHVIKSAGRNEKHEKVVEK